MNSTASVIRGTNTKPAASQALIETILDLQDAEGQLFVGYPILGSSDGRSTIDALYVSPTKGVVVFDLVEGGNTEGFEDRQDEAATRLQQRLLGYRDLVRKRTLQVGISSISFAPALRDRDVITTGEYPLVNSDSLGRALAEVEWAQASDELYKRTLSAIQNISTIRRARNPRTIGDGNSRGAKLQRLENSIATLDTRQSKAVIETVDGVQRIRGLAGSGKTVVLALKAAYLHAQHPTWRIGVTFFTRSLKAQFRYFINNFSIESTNEEPDWTNLRIIHSWGAPGGGDRDGLFYEFCSTNGAQYRDFSTARSEFGREEAFAGACESALNEVSQPKAVYDAILVDEAQDLPPAFLRMCYSMLDENKRLVYAYDELQTLSGEGLPSADKLFGLDDNGRPRVSFDQSSYDLGARRDIVLDRCYRNSRPVLVTAHGLGFGIYRPPSRRDTTGLVQIFDQPSLWADVGYKVTSGELSPGSDVTLIRTEETSPKFLEDHSPIDDLVQFLKFESKEEQDAWVADEIEANLGEDELRYEDIIVINTDPLSTRSNLGPIRKNLLSRGINSHLAGVDTVADVFFQPGRDSITFTGVYRAKGNEAGMVYIVNADECQVSPRNLARVRNRLFTAITRSKAWVRVVGVGPAMLELQEEYNRIKAASFALSFRYPTAGEREKLLLIHRDMSASEAAQVTKRIESVNDLIEDLEAGRLYAEDLDPTVRENLARLLNRSDDQ